ncbi:RhoGAP_domain-containing protein [Hexamita inflata]|uniref:RhoGAP_domain-containing protein n=1 Tax=Hexamita inflata TaxID=28002 RepID=A0ABP1KRA2_9EUKA
MELSPDYLMKIKMRSNASFIHNKEPIKLFNLNQAQTTQQDLKLGKLSNNTSDCIGLKQPTTKLDLIALTATQEIPQFIINAFSILTLRTPQEGLFRMSPSDELQKPLQKTLETNGNLEMQNLEVDQICSLIKYFYRKLNNPLISEKMSIMFRKSAEEDVKTIQIMTEPYRANLIYLLKQLNNFSQNPLYKMDAKNFGVVFAPNLFELYNLGDEKILKRLIENANSFE